MNIVTYLFLNLSSPFITVLIWLLIVAVALWAIDRLFPRIHHSQDERAERDF
jgi:hypothetical protein